MFREEHQYTDEQIKGTRVEKTNIGYAIFVDLQGKSIKLEFRDNRAFEFVDQLVDQAQEVRAGGKA